MNYISGDLIALADEGRFDLIVHGCNCFQQMGKGIAKDIKKRWPESFEADKAYRDAGDRSKLGTWSTAYVKTRVNTELIIINAYTQYTYWDTSDMLSMDAVSRVFDRLSYEYGHLNIGIPKIGAGLAMGNWKEIESVINDFSFRDLTCVLFTN